MTATLSYRKAPNSVSGNIDMEVHEENRIGIAYQIVTLWIVVSCSDLTVIVSYNLSTQQYVREGSKKRPSVPENASYSGSINHVDTFAKRKI